MHPTFKKLNFADQSAVYVLNAPESFEGVLTDMHPLTEVRRAVAQADQPTFLLAFCTRQAEVDALAELCAAQTVGDAAVWVACPKGTSKRYKCEFNRDNGWAALGKQGFEPVRQVALDEDWSALRFRRAEFIKSMTRGGAISEAGQARIKKKPATKGGA